MIRAILLSLVIVAAAGTAAVQTGGTRTQAGAVTFIKTFVETQGVGVEGFWADGPINPHSLLDDQYQTLRDVTLDRDCGTLTFRYGSASTKIRLDSLKPALTTWNRGGYAALVTLNRAEGGVLAFRIPAGADARRFYEAFHYLEEQCDPLGQTGF